MAIIFSPTGMPFRQKLSNGEDGAFKFSKKKGGKRVGGAQAFSSFKGSIKAMKKL